MVQVLKLEGYCKYDKQNQHKFNVQLFWALGQILNQINWVKIITNHIIDKPNLSHVTPYPMPLQQYI